MAHACSRAAATGRLIRTFEGHGGDVTSVAFSPDGARLLSGSHDSTMRLWDATSGQLIRTFFESRAEVDSVAFSPDGARVLSGGKVRGKGEYDEKTGTLKLWDTASGQPIRTFEGHPKPVTSVAFSPDGSRLLSGDP